METFTQTHDTKRVYWVGQAVHDMKAGAQTIVAGTGLTKQQSVADSSSVIEPLT